MLPSLASNRPVCLLLSLFPPFALENYISLICLASKFSSSVHEPSCTSADERERIILSKAHRGLGTYLITELFISPEVFFFFFFGWSAPQANFLSSSDRSVAPTISRVLPSCLLVVAGEMSTRPAPCWNAAVGGRS